ncbi:[citrate (pro-3S)-lyase] ligase [Sedimentibacter saalensis]|uniref:[Citrate [pro-3S]-lyase] ligase n=1 Tax=Sedimentibacter saalensis TaxID=130788 RepID=A0A562JC82_9FIRM|nr:[citrate (pro-3S)-lyase] ligase [Sedimentibacter saalensis]TWH80733.1 [citrate (pro-3S)-lyase] ligase [Sedimentibacter saalensis]
MGYETFYEEFGFPLKGSKLEKLKNFLKTENLSYDEGIEFTVNLCLSDGKIAATGSLQGNVLKCIAVADEQQGEGLAAKIVTLLTSKGFENGHSHMFLFTKTENINIFSDLGFYLIAETKDAALMENIKGGIRDFVNSIKGEHNSDNAGAIVLNCNPFTNGHLYLVETAAKMCSILHLFVVSEDKSIFPAGDRYELVKRGVEHLNNVVVHPTSDYLISSATFPTYFMKDTYKAGDINCMLDLTIFCQHFAKPLNITRRFVGTEPFDVVTASYNIMMKKFLGERGIEVIEIPRFEEDNVPVSASLVRKLMAEGNLDEIKKIVPRTTFEYIISGRGMKIAEKLRNSRV